MKTLIAALSMMAALCTVGVATGTADAATATPLPVAYSFIPCINGNASFQCPKVKPVGLILGNGGAPRIARMVWHTWNQTSASATDLTTIDDCIPNCAMGHDHTYRGSMYLHGIRTHNGRHYFYLMTWRYVKNGVTHAQRLVYGLFCSKFGCGKVQFWH